LDGLGERERERERKREKEREREKEILDELGAGSGIIPFTKCSDVEWKLEHNFCF
jgi:hypothetical protein